ncbi:MAG: hypothetical protein IJW89_06790, partial [Clostridia bacterium]|nr:hypothetical protein [Clostridia bacterium]
AQRELAAEDKHLYMVASSQFSINRMENGREINDQDPYHWTTEPMLRIGELVGKCITEHLL